jgi:hypothetical protein
MNNLTKIADALNANSTDNHFELAIDLADANAACPGVDYDWADANGCHDEIRFDDGRSIVLSGGEWVAE